MNAYLWGIIMILLCVLLGCAVPTHPDSKQELCTQPNNSIRTVLCDCNGQEILKMNMSSRTEFKKLEVRDCPHLSVTGTGYFDEIVIKNSKVKIEQDENILRKQAIHLHNVSIDNIPCGIDYLEAINSSIESLECSNSPKITILINASVSEMALDLRSLKAAAITINDTDIKHLSRIAINKKTIIKIHNSSAFCSAQARNELTSKDEGFCKEDLHKDEPRTITTQHKELLQEYLVEEENQIMGLFVEPNASSNHVQDVISNAILSVLITLYLTKS